MLTADLPLDWTPPQSPVAYDLGPDSSAEIRVAYAMQRILEARGPMTADDMTAALVMAGYGPLIDAMYSKVAKHRAPRQPSPYRQESFGFASAMNPRPAMAPRPDDEITRERSRDAMRRDEPTHQLDQRADRLALSEAIKRVGH